MKILPSDRKTRWLLLAALVAFVLLEVFFAQRLRIALAFGVIGVVVFSERKSRMRDRTDREALAAAEGFLDERDEQERQVGPAAHRGMSVVTASRVRKNAADSMQGFLRLAEYANQRREPVEAHYWALRALIARQSGARAAMQRYRLIWESLGCHSYHGQCRVDFTEEAAAFSLAVLRYSCHINEIGSVNQIVSLARHGNEEALAYLKTVRLCMPRSRRR